MSEDAVLKDHTTPMDPTAVESLLRGYNNLQGDFERLWNIFAQGRRGIGDPWTVARISGKRANLLIRQSTPAALRKRLPVGGRQDQFAGVRVVGGPLNLCAVGFHHIDIISQEDDLLAVRRPCRRRTVGLLCEVLLVATVRIHREDSVVRPGVGLYEASVGYFLAIRGPVGLTLLPLRVASVGGRGGVQGVVRRHGAVVRGPTHR